MEPFDLGKWCDAVDNAAHGVINPMLLPKDRRKWEKELAGLTTPGKCIQAMGELRELILKIENKSLTS